MFRFLCPPSLLQDNRHIYRQRPQNLWTNPSNDFPQHFLALRDDPHELLQALLHKLNRKVKFLSRLQIHYNLFLHRPTVQVNQPQRQRSRRQTRPKVNSMTTNNSTNEKSRTKNRNQSSLRPVEQVTQNIFEGGKKTVTIFNLTRSTNSSEFLTHSMSRSLGQLKPETIPMDEAMGDHVQVTDPSPAVTDVGQMNDPETPVEGCQSSNELRSRQLQQRICSPVCTPQIVNNEKILVDTRFSAHLLQEPEVMSKIGEAKRRRALQLQIIQQKIEVESTRNSLEWNEKLDKDWLLIHKEVEEVKGEMVIVRRSIQCVADPEIIFHEDLQSSFLHQRLEESAREFHEFVRNLDHRRTNPRQEVAENEGNEPSSILRENSEVIPRDSERVKWKCQNSKNCVDHSKLASHFNFSENESKKKKKQERLRKFLIRKSQKLNKLKRTFVGALRERHQIKINKKIRKQRSRSSNARSILVII